MEKISIFGKSKSKNTIRSLNTWTCINEHMLQCLLDMIPIEKHVSLMRKVISRNIILNSFTLVKSKLYTKSLEHANNVQMLFDPQKKRRTNANKYFSTNL